MTQAPIHIGTSGWCYDHWQDVFYPAHTPGNRMLEYYVQQFSSVEINSAFYRLPERQTLQHWYDSTPAGFRFAIKASRYITHMKKLRDPEDTVPVLLDRIAILDDKLGPVLFQLPPHWRFNGKRLKTFIESLSRDFRYAFEFRDHSWLNDETCALLAQQDAALCIYDLDGFLSPKQVTTDFCYVRLHGPGAAYQGSYSEADLSGWRDFLGGQTRSGVDSYCFFDNDQLGYAPQNALRLQAMTATGN